MRTLRNVASTGRTIICTVHQPSYELFAQVSLLSPRCVPFGLVFPLHCTRHPCRSFPLQFDDLLLLQRGGWQVYYGPLGRPFVRYLEALPGVSLCPPDTNVATWMLDVLAAGGAQRPAPPAAATKVPLEPTTVAPVVAVAASVGVSTVGHPAQEAAADAAGVAAGAQLLSAEGFQAAYYESRAWKERGSRLVEAASAPPPLSTADSAHEQSSDRLPSLLYQFVVLARRELVSSNRNVGLNRGRVGSLVMLVRMASNMRALHDIATATRPDAEHPLRNDLLQHGQPGHRRRGTSEPRVSQ